MPDTVTVACKLPSGLQCEIADYTFEDMGANRAATKSNVKTFFLRGWAQERIGDNNERMGEHHLVKGGYGLTQVPKEDWEKWLEQSKDTPYVRNGLIFASPTLARATAQAIEQKEIKSGLEAIKPNVIENGRVVSGDPDPRTVFGSSVVGEETESRARRRARGTAADSLEN